MMLLSAKLIEAHAELAPWCVAFSPDGQLVEVASSGSWYGYGKVANQKSLRNTERHTRDITVCLF
jgi:hypothetical protein